MKNLLTLLFALTGYLAQAMPADSITVTVRHGKKYIVHAIEPNETLYSLARRYGTTVEAVRDANMVLKANRPLIIRQQLLFPVNEKADRPKTPAVAKQMGPWHFVSYGETIFGISQAYGQSVADIRRWNNLTSNTLTIGQKLIVQPPAGTSGPAADEPEKPTEPTTRPAGPVTDYVPNAPTGRRIQEDGLVTVIESTRTTNRLLGLHKTAPEGSMIKITNESNGLSVLVRVIGRLPETGNNEGIQMRITPAAFRKLQGLESRIRAKMDYVLPPGK